MSFEDSFQRKKKPCNCNINSQSEMRQMNVSTFWRWNWWFTERHSGRRGGELGLVSLALQRRSAISLSGPVAFCTARLLGLSQQRTPEGLCHFNGLRRPALASPESRQPLSFTLLPSVSWILQTCRHVWQHSIRFFHSLMMVVMPGRRSND